MTGVRLTGLRKSYGSTTVLAVEELELRGGQIVALAGENGAGKSTLTGILSGIVTPDEGIVEIAGSTLRAGDPRHAQQLGVSLVSQEFPLVGQLPVAENLLLGQRPAGTSRLFVNRGATRREAIALLDRLGVAIEPDRLVETLTVPQQQLIEIAKALGREPSVLVLDEPTSALGPVESAAVLGAARDLAQQGAVVVFIGHRLDEVREVADRVVVLRNGRLAADLTPDEATEQRLVRAMVGAELSDLVGQPPTAGGDRIALRATGLAARGLGPVDLTVHDGEILGIAGLMGSGRSRLLHTIMGATTRTAGTMTLGDEPYEPRSPADAVAVGVGLVPEDRQHQALLLDAPLRWNVSLAALRGLARPFLSPARERAFATEVAGSANVKYQSIEQAVRGLSGGNQQKSVFGRWFAVKPRLLLLDEPTRGVDIGAKAGIYRLIETAAADGMTVVVASSELEELMQLTHRIAVMSRGHVVRTIDRDQFSKESIMTAATSGAAPLPAPSPTGGAENPRLSGGGPMTAIAAEPGSRQRWATRLAATPEIGVISAVVVLFIAFSLASDSFSSVSNLQTMGGDLAQYGILSLGVSFVILTGGIDLSVGSMVALTAVLSAWLNARAGLGVPIAILLTLLVTALIGVIHGLFVTRLGVPPFVTTLVTLVAARGAALAITKGFPIDGVSSTFTDLNAYRMLLVPMPTVIFIVLCVLAWVFLERTHVGRQIYAVGGNREAARLSGIRTERRIMLTYVISSLCAGVVGVLITSRLSVGQPSVGSGWELTAIAAAVIGGISLSGGTGRVVGVAFGSILLVIINTGLVILHVSPYYQQIVLGLVLAVAITTDRVRSRRLARSRTPVSQPHRIPTGGSS